MSVRITRSKVMRSRFATGPGFAWKYLYDVIGTDDKPIVQGTDRLDIARKYAKQAAKPDKHVEEWKQEFCSHGYFVTNKTTRASKQCWNQECRANG